ncbi:conserved hypothetical protein [Histoplasma mississippiense (nom. inval.)]|uniref:conserved hypothetical protein n=1 Tax=Ajellomyces capsulatus (strain NAm1 / WU24) TaxID=2059318 RepID=UPI000157BDD4|nr:conserved hypothetical protein [Histoplasma mississippiense (nom. inval.)]EDN06193.1 conserved hypothetical protein [Histoplasma mississippiense (nom. inval.)]
MSLVQYSDSESDENDNSPRRDTHPTVTKLSKRPQKLQHTDRNNDRSSNGDGNSGNTTLPPLPSEFLDLYATNSRLSVQDDPSLHHGRKRIMPHVAGNWPTHIYLESRCDQKLQSTIHGLLHTDLGAQVQLHISLSRPVMLLTEDRQPFRDLLTDALRESDIRPFHVKPVGLDWVSNFEETRWFLVLRVTKPTNNELNRLLAISNKSLAAFQQPPLYHDEALVNTQTKKHDTEKSTGPRSTSSLAVADYSDYFHVSIAWSLAEPSLEDKERVASVELHKVKEIEIPFTSVKLRIGNIIHNLELPTLVLDEGY